MKKLISVLLAVVMLFGAFGCISAFAADEKYPPVETTSGASGSELAKYKYVSAADNREIEFKDISALELPEPLPLEELDETTINEIKNDYSSISPSEVEDIYYYGKLSDDSLLVNVSVKLEGEYAFLDVVPGYKVVGKYVYVQSAYLYKNHQFSSIYSAYVSGELSDELLDEVAVILNFAKFADPSEQTATEPETTDPEVTKPTENSVSTADTPQKNNTGNSNTANASNNANGSIPTGQSNYAIVLAVLLAAASAAVLFAAKKKKSL